MTNQGHSDGGSPQRAWTTRAASELTRDALPTVPTGATTGPVGVGIAIARDPLHRSGRAVLPHPAPTSGSDVEALRGPWMADFRWR
jgi:hypothetical protein